ncbi:hypothetical protein HUU61_01135 [Rhodopseudomonas palustris]|nr:hypothetical protein [Rhodopseudomonas palustris]
MEQTEPPSCSSHIVLIGKNHRGGWVALEQTGRYGGLFVSRAAALKFALLQNGSHPETIFDAAHVLELSLNGIPSSPRLASRIEHAAPRRRAA